MKRRVVPVGSSAVTVYEVQGAGDLTVLFLHGVGGTGKVWTWQMRALRPFGRMLAVDLPGFSGGVLPETITTLGDWVPFLGRLLDDLGVTSAVWVGNSLGGRIAVEAAVETPERVDGLGLLCSAGVQVSKAEAGGSGGGPRGGGVPSPAQTCERETTIQTRFSKEHPSHEKRDLSTEEPGDRSEGGSLVELMRVSHDEWDRRLFYRPEMFAAVQTDESREMVQEARALYAQIAAKTKRLDFTELLPDIQVPTQVIWGEHDGVIPVAAGQVFADRIPNAQFTVLHQSAHVPQVEQPDEVNEVLRELLQTVAEAKQGSDGGKARL